MNSYDYEIDEEEGTFIVQDKRAHSTVVELDNEDDAKTLVDHLNGPYRHYQFDHHPGGGYDLLDPDGQPFLFVSDRDLAIAIIEHLNR